MITADNITDEQIRELFYEAVDRNDRSLNALAQVALGEWHGAHGWQASDTEHTPACAICGGAPKDEARSGTPIHIEHARARCAEILNARAASGGRK